MNFVKVFETGKGRQVGYDADTYKIVFGHGREFEQTEREIVKLIIMGVIHNETKLETLEKILKLYGDNAEFYAEGILSGMALTIPNTEDVKNGVRKCTL